MSRKTVLLCATILVAVPLLLRLLIRAISTRPTNLGVTNGRLADCPDSPNCVSTEAADAEHSIAPLTFDGLPEAAFGRLRSNVVALPGARLIVARDDYLYFEFTSRLMGFVDDVEFLLDAREHKIRFRSASRLGRSDLGVNRARMERIRRAFDSHE